MLKGCWLPISKKKLRQLNINAPLPGLRHGWRAGFRVVLICPYSYFRAFDTNHYRNLDPMIERCLLERCLNKWLRVDGKHVLGTKRITFTVIARHSLFHCDLQTLTVVLLLSDTQCFTVISLQTLAVSP